MAALSHNESQTASLNTLQLSNGGSSKMMNTEVATSVNSPAIESITSSIEKDKTLNHVTMNSTRMQQEKMEFISKPLEVMDSGSAVLSSNCAAFVVKASATGSALVISDKTVDSVSVRPSSSLSRNTVKPSNTQLVTNTTTSMATECSSKSLLQTETPGPVVVIEEQGANSTKSQTVIKLTTESQTVAGSKGILKCEECDYSTFNKHYLKQHVDLVHSDVRPYKCPFCDYAGKRSHSLKEHLVVHSNDRPYECHLCNATFRKKGHLTNHIKMHSPSITAQLLGESGILGNQDDQAVNIFICGQCEFAATSKAIFLKHLSTCSKKPVIRSEQPLESPAIKSTFPHIPSILPASPVVLMKCTECGFTSADKELLKKHMWVHITQPLAKSSEKAVTPGTDIPDKINNVQLGQPQEQSSNTSFKCGECCHETKEASKFIAHMLTHKAVPKLDSSAVVQPNVLHLPFLQQEARTVLVSNMPSNVPAKTKVPPPVKVAESSGFTHDKTVGRFSCNICGYTCDHQRTIKAHVWRHSGHKDIDYPMFQNGPVSIYDDVSSENTENFQVTSANDSNMCMKLNVCPSVPNQLNTGEIHQAVHRLAPENVVTVLPIQIAGKTNVATVISQSSSAPVTSLPGDLINVTEGQFKKHSQEKGQGAKADLVPKPETTENHTVHLNEETLNVLLTNSFKVASSQPTVAPVNTNISKRLISEVDTSEECSLIENTDPPVMKKLCTDQQRSSPNVVVEKVNAISQLSNFTGLRSQQSSPRAPEFFSEVGVQGQLGDVHHMNVDSNDLEPQSDNQDQLSGDVLTALKTGNADSDNVIVVSVSESPSSSSTGRILTQAEISKLIASGEFVKSLTESEEQLSHSIEVDDKVSDGLQDSDNKNMGISIDESALTLLSLLQKGSQEPNTKSAIESVENQNSENTPLPEYIVEVCEEQVVSTGEVSQPEENTSIDNTSSTDVDDLSETNKPKAGICSSLLAVIEQLRERSKSESETDEGLQISMFGKRKPRRRNQRNARESPFQLESMENVEKLEDLMETKYRCKLCHYTNSSPQLIKQHMRLHKTKKPFECSLCDFVADSSESLQDHMIQHCKMRTYQCKLCPSTFNYKSQLRAHMRAHSEKYPFICDACDFTTTNPITFRNHSRWHTDKNGLKCDTCGFCGADENDLAQHKQDGCLLHKRFVGEDCNFEAKSEEDLKEHTRDHKNRDLQCPQCEIIFPSQSSLRAHLRTHEEAKDMKCELCNFLAASSRSLKSHMKRHINDQRYVQQPLEQYKCNLCGYVCHHLPSLKSHMWRHASDKNYIYEFTNEVINAAIDYDSRQDNTGGNDKLSKPEVQLDSENHREDVGVSPDTRVSSTKKVPCLITFRCCQCGFETISKSDLNQHMKMHSDIIQKTLEVSKTLSQGGIATKRVHVETFFDSSPASQSEESSVST